MILFQSKQIIPFALYDPAVGLPLAVHGGSCVYFTLNIQISEHFLENWYLVCLLMNTFLGENHTIFCHICAENL